jgi:cephalosporin-C deacetylase-like acetyl esterase
MEEEVRVDLGEPIAAEFVFPWELSSLRDPPIIHPAPDLEEEGLTALFYDSVAWKGKPTKVFAYIGLPKKTDAGKVPGVVLVHGGGGTAFAEWVRVWVQRGYAAIAMDLEGHIPVSKDKQGLRPAHPWSGPERQGIFADFRESLRDQWMYHAVADVLLAHSLLRSFAEVDVQRIGITGISWGGILTSLISGIDPRFAFAIPVYGCGYLFDAGNQYTAAFTAMGDEQDKIRKLWDPSAYLSKARMPMLWMNGLNDTHFPLTIFGGSYEVSKGHQPSTTLSVIPGLKHGHQPGWMPEEIYAFADSMVKGGPKLPRFDGQTRDGRNVSAKVHHAGEGSNAELYYLTETCDWPTASWKNQKAIFETSSGQVRALIPNETKYYFLRLTDDRGLCACTALKQVGGQ